MVLLMAVLMVLMVLMVEVAPNRVTGRKKVGKSLAARRGQSLHIKELDKDRKHALLCPSHHISIKVRKSP